MPFRVLAEAPARAQPACQEHSLSAEELGGRGGRRKVSINADLQQWQERRVLAVDVNTGRVTP
jgi:hypothetical protein